MKKNNPDRFALRSKNILVISPNPWGSMFLSKHHYAIELAKRGNNVYYLSPMDNNFKKRLEIGHPTELRDLHIVSCKPFFPLMLRFHMRWLFDLLMTIQFKWLLNKLKVDFDVVWCFNPYHMSTFKIFRSKLNIYHMVDQVFYKPELRPALSADMVLSVSELILKDFKKYNKYCFLVNHGAGDEFVEYGRRLLGNIASAGTGDKIKVGYSGSLFSKNIDRPVFKRIIEENPAVEFVFWGPTILNDCNVGAWESSESFKFIKFLKSRKNVTLKGVKSQDVLAGEIQDMDAFIICYNIAGGYNECSNSHKILEYLSTGKVIVANHISEYKKNPGLIEMLEDGNNGMLPDLFKRTVNNLSLHNNHELRRRRIEFALNNSYSKQIERIEKLAQENILC